MTVAQWIAAGACGCLVGFTLALVGGGGSILAVPLMVYVVGVRSAHAAIGTSALAVAANAAMGLYHHARQRNVDWRNGAMFAGAGIVGAIAGSTAGKRFDGQRLLFLFALVMVLVAMLMLRGRRGSLEGGTDRPPMRTVRVVSYGIGAGVFSGFFGIGGGFLIVPGLIGSTGMSILQAIGTSLVAVTAFGLTTALNYAESGLVDWPLAGVFIAGGAAGSLLGASSARGLGQNGRLTHVFAAVLLSVAAYTLWRSYRAFLA